MELLSAIACFLWLGLPAAVIVYFFRTKNTQPTWPIMKVHRVLFLIWLVRGGFDYFLGINFYGRLPDYIVEYFFPWIIVVSGLFYWDVNHELKEWLRSATFLVYLYNLLYLPLAFVLMVGKPLTGGKYYPREIYNGAYYRIDQSGALITMSDNFNGTHIRYYKKYFWVEHRVRQGGFYLMDTLFNVQETKDSLIFDVKYRDIPDTLHQRAGGRK